METRTTPLLILLSSSNFSSFPINAPIFLQIYSLSSTYIHRHSVYGFRLPSRSTLKRLSLVLYWPILLDVVENLGCNFAAYFAQGYGSNRVASVAIRNYLCFHAEGSAKCSMFWPSYESL